MPIHLGSFPGMIVKAALGVFDSLCEKFEQSLQFFRFQLMKKGGVGRDKVRLSVGCGSGRDLHFSFA